MKKVLSILLTSLLLLSSTGITYAQHFCKGKIVADQIMIGIYDLDCYGGKKDTLSHEKIALYKAQKPDCCQNVYHQVSTDDNFSGSYFQIDFEQSVYVSPLFSGFFVREDLAVSHKKTTFSKYLPPPFFKDFLVLYQRFII